MNVELSEFACLKALILLQNDLGGLSATSRENVKESRERILRSFFNQLFQRLQNATEASLRLSNLLIILPSLFSIGKAISLNSTLGPLFGLCDLATSVDSLLSNNFKHSNISYKSEFTNEIDSNNLQNLYFKIPASTLPTSTITNSRPFIDNNKKEISNFLLQFNNVPTTFFSSDNKNETMMSKEILLANILAAHNQHQKQEKLLENQNYKNSFSDSLTIENNYQTTNNNSKDNFESFQSTSKEYENQQNTLNSNISASTLSVSALSAFSSIPSIALISTSSTPLSNTISKSPKSLINLSHVNTLKSTMPPTSCITLESLNNITSVSLPQLAASTNSFQSLFTNDKQIITNNNVLTETSISSQNKISSINNIQKMSEANSAVAISTAVTNLCANQNSINFCGLKQNQVTFIINLFDKKILKFDKNFGL